MKRSRVIQLTLVTSVATALLSCNERPTRYCADENQKATDDWLCEEDQSKPSFYHRFHWYYGGSSGPVPNGTALHGGSSEPPAEGFVTSKGVTVRGGFGEAGEAAGGGHGGGGEGGE